MKNMKKLFAVAFALCLVISMAVITFAAEGDSAEEPKIVYGAEAFGDTVTIPAKTAVYYNVYGVSGTELVVEGEGALVVYDEVVYAGEDNVISVFVTAEWFMSPVAFAIINDSDVEATYSVSFNIPLGDYSNPQTLTTDDLMYFSTDLVAGDGDGYYYTWTSDYTGYLCVAAFGYDEEYNEVISDVIVMNENTYAQTGLWSYNSDWEDVYAEPAVIKVNEGDVIRFNPVVMPDENWDIPAATVDVYAYLCQGNEEEFISLNYLEYVANVGAGETVTYGSYAISGMIVTIDAYDLAGLTVSNNGVDYTDEDDDGVISFVVEGGGMRMPSTITFTNANEYPGSYDIVFEYPVGDMSNPEALFGISEFTANIAEGDYDGYYYSWVVRADGKVTFSVANATEGVEYDIVLMNNNTWEMAWLSDSTDGTVSLDVAAGDEITIQVVTFPDEMYNYPAAEITVNGEFEFPVGSFDNPESIMNITEFIASIAEGNSQGYYYKWYSRANGTIVLSVAEATDGVEYDIVLTNMNTYEMAWLSDSTDGTVSLDVAAGDEVIIQVVTFPDEMFNYPAAEIAVNGEIEFPAGSFDNPEAIEELGDVAVSLEEGNSQGYYLAWTATEEGTVVFTVAGATEGVEYDIVLTNMSTYAMAWLSDSTDGTVSIEVAAGDVVNVQVVTLPDADWNYPAAEIALEVAYEEDEAPQTGFATAMLAIVAIASGAYVSKKRH